MDHPHPANIKEEGHDFLQGLMNNPLVHEVAHNIGETLSAHLHKQEDHNGNPDDIEPVFEKINADDKKDNLVGHDHLSEPVHSPDHHVNDLLGEITHAPTISEQHKVEGQNKPAASIEDFLSGDLSSLVGELTKSVFDTVKEHVATKTPESTPRTESPQPTTEVFDIKKEDESQHLPQEPIHHFSDHQEKKGDNVKVEDLTNHHSHPDEPEIPKKDNYSNISIPKVDVIAASPIPSTSPTQDELPAEPIHPKQPTDFQKKERVVDDNIEDEIACVKLKGYTVEGEIHEESHPVDEPHHVVGQHPVVESQPVDEPHHVVEQHPVADQHPEEYPIHEQHPVVEVVPHAPEHHEAEKKDFPIKEIQAESHDFKEEFVQKPEVVHESTQEHVEEVKKEVIKEEAKVEEVKKEVTKEEAKVEEVKKEEAKVEEVTKEEAVGKVVSKDLAKDVAKKIADSKVSSKAAPKPATTKPAIQPAARQLPKAAPAKPAPARAAPTPRPPPARVAPTPRPAPVRAAPAPRPAPVRTAPAPRPSSTTSTDKVPSYARPTATSSRSSIASKTPTSTINSKTTSISSTSEIKPLPKIANKYKDVKSRVFSTTTTTPATPSPPKPRPTTSTRLSSGGSNGIKPLPKSNLVWKVESKVNSFANINHKPAGGVVKTKPPPPTTKIGNVSVDVPGNINPVSTSEALGN
uniref:Microtubule-associated protein n=1 Tax=Rhabditophanes sp. KR3021 TaxID=114890 RepID=A0AC35UCW2_9BILA